MAELGKFAVSVPIGFLLGILASLFNEKYARPKRGMLKTWQVILGVAGYAAALLIYIFAFMPTIRMALFQNPTPLPPFPWHKITTLWEGYGYFSGIWFGGVFGIAFRAIGRSRAPIWCRFFNWVGIVDFAVLGTLGPAIHEGPWAELLWLFLITTFPALMMLPYIVWRLSSGKPFRPEWSEE